MKLDLEQYNQRVKQGGKEVLSDIKSTANTMGIDHRDNSPSDGSSIAQMKDGYRQRDGAITQISIKIRRSLIYPHKGAGKGRGGSKGSKWIDKFGIQKTTNQESLGKMGSGGRTAKPFINDVLESESGVDKIATIVAEELGDAIVNKVLVK